MSFPSEKELLYWERGKILYTQNSTSPKLLNYLCHCQVTSSRNATNLYQKDAYPPQYLYTGYPQFQHLANNCYHYHYQPTKYYIIAATMTIPELVTTTNAVVEVKAQQSVPNLSRVSALYKLLWGEIWITNHETLRIYQAIAQFDNGKMAGTPNEKVTQLHPHAGNHPTPFSYLSLLLLQGMFCRNGL